MAPSSGVEFLPLHRLIFGTVLGYLVFAFYAAAVRHGLFSDGAYVLLRVIVDEGFVSFQPSRRTAHLLHQLPTIAALKLGVTDLYALTFIYGLTLHLLPLFATLACYLVLPKQKKAFFVFPFLHLVTGTLGSALAPLAEAPVASAIFWLLLCLVLFGARSPAQRVGLVVLSAIALLLHEVYSFLGLALACAALYRASYEAGSRRALFAGLAAWFVVVVAVQLYYIVNPAQLANRESFVASLREFLWLCSGNVLNMPVALGMACLAVVVASWLRLERGAPPASRAVRAGVIALFVPMAAAAVALPLYSDHFIVPQSPFAARNQSAFVSLLLAALAAPTLRSRQPEVRWAAMVPQTVTAIVAAGSLGWLLVATAYWARCVDDTRMVLASRGGLIPWAEARATVPERDRRLFSRYSWGWTPPTVSILLAPGGRVASMIDSRPQVQWTPFNAADPAALPRSKLFNTDDYVKTLSESRRSSATNDAESVRLGDAGHMNEIHSQTQ